MALLARCPACDCELELPAVLEHAPADLRMECPACNHEFTSSDAEPRTVISARLLGVPNGDPSASSEMPHQTGEGADAKYGATTLSSFLNSESATDQPAESDSTPELEKLNLGDFKSLDDLFDKVSPGPIASDSDSVEDATTEKTDPPFSSTVYESTDQSADEQVMRLDEFEFGGGSNSDEPTQGLRASMGFGPSDVLEPEETVIDAGLSDAASQFGGGEVPSGTVPARRRSSPSIVKSMVGVVGGGVMALAISPLAVMWINHWRGVNFDPFKAAHFYPDVIKPAEFRSTTTTKSTVGDSNVNQSSQSNTKPGGVVSSNFETPEPKPWQRKFTPSLLPKIPINVAGAPEYSATKIVELTTQAKQAIPGLLKGDLSSDSTTLEPKGTSYKTLALLADALTYGEGRHDASWHADAREVFPALYATEQSRSELTSIGYKWITFPTRNHNGVFLCGKPDAGRQQGSVIAYMFTLNTSPTKKVPVLLPERLEGAFAKAPYLAIIGSVVDKPADKIEGYTGNARRVIWAPTVMLVNE